MLSSQNMFPYAVRTATFQLSGMASGRLITFVESIFMGMGASSLTYFMLLFAGFTANTATTKLVADPSFLTFIFTFDACSTASLSFPLMRSFSLVVLTAYAYLLYSAIIDARQVTAIMNMAVIASAPTAIVPLRPNRSSKRILPPP